MKLTLTQALLLVTLSGVSVPALAGAGNAGYVYDARGVIVRDSQDRCLRTAAWTPGSVVRECEFESEFQPDSQLDLFSQSLPSKPAKRRRRSGPGGAPVPDLGEEDSGLGRSISRARRTSDGRVPVLNGAAGSGAPILTTSGGTSASGGDVPFPVAVVLIFDALVLLAKMAGVW